MASGPELDEVYDIIFDQFRDTWNALTPAIVGIAPAIEWPDDPKLETPLSAGVVPWCRITAKHTMREITTIGFSNPGQGRIKSEGVVAVNIFVPSGKRGLTLAAQLGRVAITAFEGQRVSGLWFTDVRPEEGGVDGAWLQYNVKATFHYDNHL